MEIQTAGDSACMTLLLAAPGRWCAVSRRWSRRTRACWRPCRRRTASPPSSRCCWCVTWSRTPWPTGLQQKVKPCMRIMTVSLTEHQQQHCLRYMELTCMFLFHSPSSQCSCVLDTA